MEEKFNILDNLKKSEKPQLPTNYFEQFSEQLMDKLDVETIESNLSKANAPEVPDGFFDSFADELMDKIKAEETSETNPSKSKGRIIALRVMGFAAAAACLLLIINLVKSNEEIESSTETAVYSEEAVEDAYLAYLDEGEMINFLVENEDIELEEDELDTEDEDIFFFLNDDIEDFYYEEL